MFLWFIVRIGSCVWGKEAPYIVEGQGEFVPLSSPAFCYIPYILWNALIFGRKEELDNFEIGKLCLNSVYQGVKSTFLSLLWRNWGWNFPIIFFEILVFFFFCNLSGGHAEGEGCKLGGLIQGIGLLILNVLKWQDVGVGLFVCLFVFVLVWGRQGIV